MSDFFAPYAPADHGVPLPVCTRAATVADAGEIARIYLDRHGAEPGTDPEEIRQAIRASLAMIDEGHSTDFVAVAEVRGRVCGYGRCGERSWPEAPDLPARPRQPHPPPQPRAHGATLERGALASLLWGTRFTHSSRPRAPPAPPCLVTRAPRPAPRQSHK